MTVKRVVAPNRFIGNHADTKPTMASRPGRVRVGDTFYEQDTGDFYITYDGTNWVIKKNVPTWTFGEPNLRDSNSGSATWSRWHYQKGGTGWTAKLTGGVQSGDDWASLLVPINEMPVPGLATVLWSYNKTDSLNAGISLNIWVHDPNDQKKRAEISQTASAPGTTAGWHSEELTPTDSEYKWYGENVTDSGGSAPDTCTTTDTNYTWAQYISDSVFSTWTIYRIEFVIGWIGSGTLLDAWLAEVTINGQSITLKPDSSGTGRFGITTYTGSGNITTGGAKLAPKTPYRLLSISNKINAAHGGASSFVVNLLSEAGTVFDAAILTDDMYVPTTRTSLYATFGQGYEYGMDDELDILYTNNSGKTYGIVYRYEILVD